MMVVIELMLLAMFSALIVAMTMIKLEQFFVKFFKISERTAGLILGICVMPIMSLTLAHFFLRLVS